MSVEITNKTITKYFGFLRKLDNNSKKRLIIKLTESIETKDDSSFEINSLYGAWEDSKDSDQIIKEIRDSRIEKNNLENFWWIIYLIQIFVFIFSGVNLI